MTTGLEPQYIIEDPKVTGLNILEENSQEFSVGKVLMNSAKPHMELRWNNTCLKNVLNILQKLETKKKRINNLNGRHLRYIISRLKHLKIFNFPPIKNIKLHFLNARLPQIEIKFNITEVKLGNLLSFFLLFSVIYNLQI
jgi:hypothetical protein